MNEALYALMVAVGVSLAIALFRALQKVIAGE